MAQDDELEVELVVVASSSSTAELSHPHSYFQATPPSLPFQMQPMPQTLHRRHTLVYHTLVYTSPSTRTLPTHKVHLHHELKLVVNVTGQDHLREVFKNRAGQEKGCTLAFSTTLYYFNCFTFPTQSAPASWSSTWPQAHTIFTPCCTYIYLLPKIQDPVEKRPKGSCKSWTKNGNTLINIWQYLTPLGKSACIGLFVWSPFLDFFDLLCWWQAHELIFVWAREQGGGQSVIVDMFVWASSSFLDPFKIFLGCWILSNMEQHLIRLVSLVIWYIVFEDAKHCNFEGEFSIGPAVKRHSKQRLLNFQFYFICQFLFFF